MQKIECLFETKIVSRKTAAWPEKTLNAHLVDNQMEQSLAETHQNHLELGPYTIQRF